MTASTSVTFTTTLKQFGPNNTGIEVPEEVLAALGRGKRVPVVVGVGGHSYRSTVTPYAGRILIPFSSEQRAATGLTGGETIEVTLTVDEAPREVTVPDDLAAAMAAAPAARAFFDGLSYTNRKSYVTWIEEAKKAETRSARVEKAIELLLAGKTR